MRKILFSIFCTIFINQLLAQGFSIGFAGGYGAGVLTQTCGNSGENTTINYASLSSAKPYKVSLGKGYDFQMEISNSFKNGFELGLATSYHTGIPFSYSLSTDYTTHSSGNSSTYNMKESFSYKEIHQLQFMPFVKTSLGVVTKPYLKFGFILGCLGEIQLDYKRTEIYSSTNNQPPPNNVSSYNTFSSESTTKYKGGTSAGFIGALGVERKLVGSLFFTAECSFIAMQWSPNKAKQSYSQSYDSIDEANKSNWSYSSFRILAGMRYVFGKKNVSKQE